MSKNGFTMTEEEAQVVVDSIVKWETSGYAGDCPLCIVYPCNRCPIDRYTGEASCLANENPYYDIEDGIVPDQAMIDFLNKMLAAAGWEVADVGGDDG